MRHKGRKIFVWHLYAIREIDKKQQNDARSAPKNWKSSHFLHFLLKLKWDRRFERVCVSRLSPVDYRRAATSLTLSFWKWNEIFCISRSSEAKEAKWTQLTYSFTRSSFFFCHFHSPRVKKNFRLLNIFDLCLTFIAHQLFFKWKIFAKTRKKPLDVQPSTLSIRFAQSRCECVRTRATLLLGCYGEIGAAELFLFLLATKRAMIEHLWLYFVDIVNDFMRSLFRLIVCSIVICRWWCFRVSSIVVVLVSRVENANIFRWRANKRRKVKTWDRDVHQPKWHFFRSAKPQKNGKIFLLLFLGREYDGDKTFHFIICHLFNRWV